MKNPEFVASVVLTIITAFVIALWVPGKDGWEKIELTLAYGGLVLIFLFGFLILAGIASGKIDIRLLLAEAGGGASMSRFQLLIFIFVIGLSFFMVVAHTHSLPDPPANVLALLGISATTYGVSKGIQATGMQKKSGADDDQGNNKGGAVPPGD